MHLIDVFYQQLNEEVCTQKIFVLPFQMFKYIPGNHMQFINATNRCVIL
jgi:hypothetical protein